MVVDEPGSETERVLMFTDAVVAIAATLLVLDIHLPDGETEVGQALLALWPKAFVYALSFLIIYSFWITHRRVFRSLVRTDAVLLWLNGLFLLCVAFLPLPVGIWRTHPRDHTAVVLYALSMAVTAATLSAIWWYASCHPVAMLGQLTVGVERRMAFLTIAFPAIFLASIPVASLSVRAANGFWVLAIILAPILTRRGGSPSATPSNPENLGAVSSSAPRHRREG